MLYIPQTRTEIKRRKMSTVTSTAVRDKMSNFLFFNKLNEIYGVDNRHQNTVKRILIFRVRF